MKGNEDNIYTLKSKNVSICDVRIEYNNIVEIIKVYDKKYAPVETIPFQELSVDRLNDWLSQRAIPIERDGYHKVLEELHISNNKKYLIDNLSLSLSDQFWLKPNQLDVTWEDVNFFDNDYNIIEFSDATFGQGNNISSSWQSIYLNTKKFITPNASLGGVLKKIWVQKDKMNYMIKGSHTIHNLEPIHEVLASKIAKILCLNCVEYGLIEIKGKRSNQLASICKDIVNSSEHIVSAYSLILGFPEVTIKDYTKYIDFLDKELSIPNAQEDVQKMLMLDYIMMNEDRHFNNFGVIRDSHTLQWKQVCPVYDTGKSLNTAINEDYWDFANGEIRAFDGNIVSVDYLLDYIHIPIEKNSIELMRNLYSWYKNTLVKYKDILKMKDETIDKLSQGLLRRIDCFEKAMSEKHLIIENNLE